MTWRDDPRIRQLEPYAEQHGYATIVLFAIHDNGTEYTVTTYGKTAKLCKAAKQAGDAIHELIQSGRWPIYTITEPDGMPNVPTSTQRRTDGNTESKTPGPPTGPA